MLCLLFFHILATKNLVLIKFRINILAIASLAAFRVFCKVKIEKRKAEWEITNTSYLIVVTCLFFLDLKKSFAENQLCLYELIGTSSNFGVFIRQISAFDNK